MSPIDDADAFDAALSGAAPTDTEIASLLSLARQVAGSAAAVEPSPTFRASVRSALISDAAIHLAPPGIRPAGVASRATDRSTSGVAVVLARVWAQVAAQSRRRLAIVAATFITAFGLTGISAASASALPGETLYAVKRGIENVRLSITTGDSDRGKLLLDLAARRLAEAHGLAERTAVPSELEADTLDDYAAQAAQGSDALVRAFTTTRADSDIVTLNRFATESAQLLDQLDGELDGPAAESLDAAQAHLKTIVTIATDLCPGCEGADPSLASELSAANPPPRPRTERPERPPSTESPVAEPTLTERPDPEPPATESPVAEPPVIAPPGIAPLATEPPVAEPPAVDTQPTAAPPAPSVEQSSQEEPAEQDDSDGDSEGDSEGDDSRPDREITQLPLPIPAPSPEPTPTPRPPAQSAHIRCEYGMEPDPRSVTCSLDMDESGLLQFDWDFGDFETAKGLQVQHSYAGPGTYTIRVSATFLLFTSVYDEVVVTIE